MKVIRVKSGSRLKKVLLIEKEHKEYIHRMIREGKISEVENIRFVKPL